MLLVCLFGGFVLFLVTFLCFVSLLLLFRWGVFWGVGQISHTNSHLAIVPVLDCDVAVVAPVDDARLV